MIKIATLICACFAASFVNAEMEVTLTGVQTEHLYPFTGSTLLIAVQDANEITIKSTGKIVVTGNGIATDRSIEIHQQDHDGKIFLVKINKNPNAINSLSLNSSSNVKIMVHKLHSEVLDRSNETISLKSNITGNDLLNPEETGVISTMGNIAQNLTYASGKVLGFAADALEVSANALLNGLTVAKNVAIITAIGAPTVMVSYWVYQNGAWVLETSKWVYENGKWLWSNGAALLGNAKIMFDGFKSWWESSNSGASQGYWPGDRNPSPDHVQEPNNPFINDDPDAAPRNYEPRNDGLPNVSWSWTDSPRNDNFTPNAYNPAYMTTPS